MQGDFSAAILRTESYCTKPQLLHTDVKYERDPKALICIIALEDNTRVRVLPRSHLYISKNDLKNQTSDAHRRCNLRCKIITLSKGDAIFMHPKLYHSGWYGSCNFRFHFCCGEKELPTTFLLIDEKSEEEIEFFQDINTDLEEFVDNYEMQSDRPKITIMEALQNRNRATENEDADQNLAKQVGYFLFNNLMVSNEAQLKITKELLIPLFTHVGWTANYEAALNKGGQLNIYINISIC